MSGHRALHDLLVAPYEAGELDPGDAGTFKIDRQFCHFKVTTAGASETRVLATPTKAGLVVCITHYSDGGDFTLTVTGGYNAAGDTTIAFDAEKDSLVLMSIQTTTSYRWLVIAGDAVEAIEAAAVDVRDSGSLITATNVEAALAEAFQHIQSAQAYLNLPLGAWTEQDGTALADFSDGDSTTPGWNAGDETFGIRWNNHANPDPITTSVPIPPDLDASADVILHIMSAKTGNTAGDTVNWTVEAFNVEVGSLYDADTDFGGECAALTGDATAKTVQLSELTLAAADVESAPCILTLTLQPKDGELGTDDVILMGAWLEYTRQTLTS